EGPYHPSSEEGRRMSQREENEILRHKDEQKGGSENPRGTTKEEGKEYQQEMDEGGGYQLHWDDQKEDINTQWGREHPHLSHQQTEAINTEWLAGHPQSQYMQAHSTPASREYRMRRIDEAYWASRRRMQDIQWEEQSALMDKIHESLKKLESRTSKALRASQGGQGEHHREEEEKGGVETVDERVKRSAGQQSQTSKDTENEEEVSQGMGPEDEKSQPSKRSMKVRIDGEVQLTSLEQVNLWPDKEQGEAI
ncbi:MAG: hypothetical protein ACRCVL_04305, partial [Cetobacterium sp.]